MRQKGPAHCAVHGHRSTDGCCSEFGMPHRALLKGVKAGAAIALVAEILLASPVRAKQVAVEDVDNPAARAGAEAAACGLHPTAWPCTAVSESRVLQAWRQPTSAGLETPSASSAWC